MLSVQKKFTWILTTLLPDSPPDWGLAALENPTLNTTCWRLCWRPQPQQTQISPLSPVNANATRRRVAKRTTASSLADDSLMHPSSAAANLVVRGSAAEPAEDAIVPRHPTYGSPLCGPNGPGNVPKWEIQVQGACPLQKSQPKCSSLYLLLIDHPPQPQGCMLLNIRSGSIHRYI